MEWKHWKCFSLSIFFNYSYQYDWLVSVNRLREDKNDETDRQHCEMFICLILLCISSLYVQETKTERLL